MTEDALKAMACARCGYSEGTQPWCDGVYCEKWKSMLKSIGK